MRRLSLAIAGLFVLLVSAQAQAQTMTFTAALHGGNEVPAVLTGAVGTGTVSVNLATHFHVGAPGTAGPVVVNFTVANGISNDFAISGTASATDLTARAAQGINS